jgi:nucleoside-diphosphate kinase
VLVKGFAALCKEKPSAQRLEAIQWLADWLRENNPKRANAFAEEELALDPANEDAGDFETVQTDTAPVDAADVSEALDDLEEQMKAAVTVQSHFRGHQARRNAARDRAAAAGGSAVTVVLESHTDADEEHRAAAKLQATYRGHASRRETRKMQEEEAQAATKLQSGFRGFQARKEAEERRAERAELASAATKVQAGFRGHQDRKKIAAMKQAEAGEQGAPESA